MNYAPISDQDVPAQGLPPEFRGLNRPKEAGFPLEAAGCGLVLTLSVPLCGIIFAFVALYFYLSGLYNYIRLTREGIPAQATITRLETDVEINDSGYTVSYYVYYYYSVRMQGDLLYFEDYASVSRSLYQSLQVGQQIEILYAESDPKLTAIKAEFEPPSLLALLVFLGGGGLFVLIGLPMVREMLKARSQLRALRERGRHAQAFIFDRWQKGSGSDARYFVAFAFKVDSQIITRAEENRALYDKYQIGDSLTVRYLPEDPSVCQALMER